MDRLLVYGLGGHSKVIRMMIKNSPHQTMSIIADDDNKRLINAQLDLNVIHSSRIAYFKEDFDTVVLAIGSNASRRKLAEQYSNYKFAMVIDSTAIVAEDVIIGEGTVIMPRSIINPSVKIGKHCIVNSGAIVEHDCIIGDYSHISPGAVLTGGVVVGKSVHIGANATILPGLKIGDNTVIGAGTVVTKDISTNSVMIGNPMQEINKIG